MLVVLRCSQRTFWSGKEVLFKSHQIIGGKKIRESPVWVAMQDTINRANRFIAQIIKRELEACIASQCNDGWGILSLVAAQSYRNNIAIGNAVGIHIATLRGRELGNSTERKKEADNAQQSIF